MNIRCHFTSDNEIIEVEVIDAGGEDPRLVFLNHDINYDILSVSLGEDPSTAYLLHYLWYNEDIATEDSQVCFSDPEFKAENKWYRLSNSDARLVLSFKFEPGERVTIARTGNGYTIEQRIAMLQDADSYQMADFLKIYKKNDLLPEVRQKLEDSLDAESKYVLAIYGSREVYGPIQSSKRFRLIMETNDKIKSRYISGYGYRLTPSQERELVSSITDETFLFEALCASTNLYPAEIMRYAEKITNEHIRRDLSMGAPGLSFEQRRYLMGKEP